MSAMLGIEVLLLCALIAAWLYVVPKMKRTPPLEPVALHSITSITYEEFNAAIRRADGPFVPFDKDVEIGPHYSEDELRVLHDGISRLPKDGHAGEWSRVPAGFTNTAMRVIAFAEHQRRLANLWEQAYRDTCVAVNMMQLAGVTPSLNDNGPSEIVCCPQCRQAYVGSRPHFCPGPVAP